MSFPFIHFFRVFTSVVEYVNVDSIFMFSSDKPVFKLTKKWMKKWVPGEKKPYIHETIFISSTKGETMAEELTARVSVLEEKIKVSNHRIEDLEEKTDRIEKLTLSVQKLAMSVEQMAKEQIEYRSKQDQIANKLIELEQAPAKDKAKKVDSILTYVVQLIVAAIIGAFLTYIGLQI